MDRPTRRRHSIASLGALVDGPSPTATRSRRDEVADRARDVLEHHWRETGGFTVPHPVVYPWLWLWDSCFHSLIWLALGMPDRARRELSSIFVAGTSSGFLPHVNYGPGPGPHRNLWGVDETSTITQPPLFGHAIAALARADQPVDDLVDRGTAALWYLLEHRMAPCGLLRIFHPWESGSDDSPRWERWQSDPFDSRAWWKTKGSLVQALHLDGREAVGSDSFDVCPAGWNALVAWNATELAGVSGDVALAEAGGRLARSLDEQCWDAALSTWVDLSPEGERTSTVRTADALLGALVTSHETRALEAFEQLTDRRHLGLPFGPAGVHPEEPSYEPGRYWRGGGWPPFDYLWRTGADRRGWHALGDVFDAALRNHGCISGYAEYRNPETGGGLGATPQAWGFLSVVPREAAQ